MSLGSPTLSPTSAEMATADMDYMCIAHFCRVKGCTAKTKFLSDCSDVM